MTEEEWLVATEPKSMLRVVFSLPQRSSRKERLFVCGSCRRVWHELTSDLARSAIAVGEQYADGEAGESDLYDAVDGVRTLSTLSGLLARCAANSAGGGRPMQVVDVAGQFAASDGATGWDERKWEAEWLAHCHLLRDIFGNPFRPVTFQAAWRTSTAIALASQMYESREFGAMPILADALQDAGCDNDDILNHCRDAKQVHVRGCWVVDLVLGKE